MLAGVGNHDLSPEAVERIQAVLIDTGALAQSEASIDALTHQAIAAMEAAPIEAEVLTALTELAEFVAWRDT